MGSAPQKWPPNPIYKDGKKCALCAEPNSYRVEGGPANEVTSDLEIIPQYDDGSIAQISVVFNTRLLDDPHEDNQYNGDMWTFIDTETKTYDTEMTDDGQYYYPSAVRQKIINDISAYRDKFKDTFRLNSITSSSPPTDMVVDSEIKEILESSFNLTTPKSKTNSFEVLNGVFGAYDMYCVFYEFSDEEEENPEYKVWRNSAQAALGTRESPPKPTWIGAHWNYIKDVGREAYYYNKKTLVGWPSGYEMGTIHPFDERQFIIYSETDFPGDNNGDGSIDHFRTAKPLPYVHFVYGDSTPDEDLRGTEISAVQFDPREYGDFSDLSVAGKSFEGYNGSYGDLIVPTKEFVSEINWDADVSREEKYENLAKVHDFFKDVTFTYEYSEDSSHYISYEVIWDDTVDAEHVQAIKNAYLGYSGFPVIDREKITEDYDYESQTELRTQEVDDLTSVWSPESLDPASVTEDLTVHIIFSLASADVDYSNIGRVETHSTSIGGGAKFWENSEKTTPYYGDGPEDPVKTSVKTGTYAEIYDENNNLIKTTPIIWDSNDNTFPITPPTLPDPPEIGDQPVGTYKWATDDNTGPSSWNAGDTIELTSYYGIVHEVTPDAAPGTEYAMSYVDFWPDLTINA